MAEMLPPLAARDAVSAALYAKFNRLLADRYGIALGAGKTHLLVTRTRALLSEFALDDYDALYAALEGAAGSPLEARFLDAITTRETAWFRDDHVYRTLVREVLPAVIATADRPVRIWSAACATGAEAYAICIALAEHAEREPAAEGWQVEIVASDISAAALARARAAVYEPYELVLGLTSAQRDRYFDEDGGRLRVCAAIRERVRFESANLLDSFYQLGPFDVIFCRNALMYFNTGRKTEILRRLAAVLEPGGLLFVGPAEQVIPYQKQFQPVAFSTGVGYRLSG